MKAITTNQEEIRKFRFAFNYAITNSIDFHAKFECTDTINLENKELFEITKNTTLSEYVMLNESLHRGDLRYTTSSGKGIYYLHEVNKIETLEFTGYRNSFYDGFMEDKWSLVQTSEPHRPL